MADQINSPGVDIIQEFRQVSPTVFTPTLQSCVVGPSFQLVEALEQDANGNNVLNTDAIAAVPPILDSLNSEDYAGLDGLTFEVSVNNGVAQTVTFSDPTSAGLSADQVKSQVLSTSGISGWSFYTISKGANVYLQLRGNSAGDNQLVKILSGTANSILGFPSQFELSGFSSYTQDKRKIAQANFPDPRNNIAELDIDEDTIRVFLNQAGSLLELKRDESFLRNGSLAFNLGTAITFRTTLMKNKTLLLTLEKGGSEQIITFSGDFYAMDGTLIVPTSAYAQPGTDSFSLQKNNDTPVTVTFSTPADIAAAITAINAAWASTYTGEDVAYRALVDGSASGSGTYIAFQVGGNTPTGDRLKVIEGLTGNAFSDLGFVLASGAMHSSLVYVINQALNAPTAYPVAVDGGANKLRLQSWNGYLAIGAGTGNTTLGLTSSTVKYALSGLDDGDGDTKSPLVRVPNEDFTLDPTAAQLVGTLDISGNNLVHKKTFQVALDGNPMQSIEFNGGPIVPTNAYTTPGTNTFGIIVNGTLYEITFTSPTDIDDAILEINSTVGQTVCYKSNSSGVASPSGTYISYQVGGATDAGGSIVIDYAVGYATAFAALGFTGSADIAQTLTGAEIVTAINACMGVGFASLASNMLVLDSSLVGKESKIEIGLGTANAIIGFTDGDTVTGRAFKPVSGDALYADGEFLGNIIQVTPGAVSTDLKLDRELSFSLALKKNWYIIAKSIPSSLPATRPLPNLVVDLAGNITLKNDVLRDTKGNPVSTANDSILIAYKALRLDLSPRSSTPALLVFENTEELTSLMAPVSTDNPLALGLFFSLINAPARTCSGIGIDGVSADYPEGTLEAYTRALSFLESKQVYGMVPLSHESTVHQAFISHVNAMSQPEARGERIVFVNPAIPTRDLDALVVSGTDGDYAGSPNEFDTKQSNLASSLLAAGVDPSGTIDVAEGVYLDVASDSKRYSISSITGTVVTIRVAFAPGENDDAFYAVSNLPTTLISETFSIKVRGAELVDSDGNPDLMAVAETYQKLGRSIANRRVYVSGPDQVGATIDGLEQLIPGYYMDCATIGMISRLPPNQGFTNYPVTGFTKLPKSNGYFSQTQLNIIQAGGVYWYVQEVENGPISCRQQLSTDMTSLETKELSITKVVDYCAYFYRTGIRSFIGKFNITQGFIDTLSTVIQGLSAYLVEDAGFIQGADLNNILQNVDRKDQVMIDITLDVAPPCNSIRLVLLI